MRKPAKGTPWTTSTVDSLFRQIRNLAGNIAGVTAALNAQSSEEIVSAAALGDPEIQQALNVIESTYGDVVSVKSKAKNLIKFGRSPNVGTAATGFTLWYTGQDEAHETYPALNTNPIDSVSSGDTGDTQTIKIEGHTESGGNKTFVVQTVTLQGRTRVPLTTPLNRATRVVNTGSTNFAGEIYVYENTALTNGKPTDTTKIHLTVPLNTNQSSKAATALSSRDYWIVTGIYADVLEKTSAFADISLQVRESGGVFRTILTISANTNSQGRSHPNTPYIIIPPNSDVRLTAVGSGAGTDVSGGIIGYLAID